MAGSNIFEIALTMLNVFILSWLTIEITILSSNIIPAILMHFFNFETKIVVMSSRELLIAESACGMLIFILAIWLVIVRIKEKESNSKGKF